MGAYTDRQYLETAQAGLSEGTPEVDYSDSLSTAEVEKKVSQGDDEGAYVQAWVWVPDSAVVGFFGKAVEIEEGAA